MLRFHFTSDDLARVRIAPGPDPMWEVLLSAHVVNQRSGVSMFAPWRERVLSGLHPAARMLLRLTPPRGYSPDFLTPVPGTDDFETGLDAVLSTPKSRLRHDISLLARGHKPHLWMRDLADGSAQALHGLGVAMRTYYEQAVGPYWSGIRAAVDVDRAARTRAWVEGGTEHALRTLHPSVRWEYPVLSVSTAADRDVRRRPPAHRTPRPHSGRRAACAQHGRDHQRDRPAAGDLSGVGVRARHRAAQRGAHRLRA
jgi:hypothetical protein